MPNKLILITSCIIAVIADMLLVWWAKKDSHPIYSMVVGVILLLLSTLIWVVSLRKGIESATAITFYALFTVAGCSFLGLVIFNEQISTLNGIGLLLSLISLILITI